MEEMTTPPVTLEGRIAKLEAEIEGYKVQLDKAIADGNDDDKKLFGGLIKSARDNLDKLLIQQQEERYIQNVRSGAFAFAAPGSLMYQQQVAASPAPGFRTLEELKTELKQELKNEIGQEIIGKISKDISAMRQILQAAQVGKRPGRSGSEGSATESEGSDTSNPGTKPPRNSLDKDQNEDDNSS
mmetsp:Transcript_5186/g.5306  ORF Transcript_5186/g.5306 Transcript_5186/m.5306 type:complete len:185 (+) Transcript_5186:607-1161(+)